MSGYSQRQQSGALRVAYSSILRARYLAEKDGQTSAVQFWRALSDLIESKYPSIQDQIESKYPSIQVLPSLGETAGRSVICQV